MQEKKLKELEKSRDSIDAQMKGIEDEVAKLNEKLESIKRKVDEKDIELKELKKTEVECLQSCLSALRRLAAACWQSSAYIVSAHVYPTLPLAP